MPSLHPLSSSNREVGRLSSHVLTSSSRIRPQRYFIFHVKERTTAELTPALADLTHSSGRNKATSFPSNCSPPQGDITTEDWLQFYWAVFLGAKVHKGEENGKGNCFEFAFIPRKYISSENRFTTWFSCPAPFCSKAE